MVNGDIYVPINFIETSYFLLMKIIHTSDWHLGHNLYNYDRTEEQTAFLRQLCSIVSEEQPDALLICGDIYHTANPSATTQKMYTDGLLAIHQACPSMQIIVTAGNHDSAARLSVDSCLWEQFNVAVIGGIAHHADGTTNFDKHIVEITDLKGQLIGYIGAVPHVYPHNFPSEKGSVPREQRQRFFFQHLLDEIAQKNSQELPVVLTAHLAVVNPNDNKEDAIIGGMEQVTREELGTGYDYLALGHIHRPHLVHKAYPMAAYCGSPIAVDFDEDYTHSVYIIDIEKHLTSPTVKQIEINNPLPLTTVPQQPAGWDDIMNILSLWPEDKKDYIRINLKGDEKNTPDMTERICKLLEEKQSRFCYVKLNKNESKNAVKNNQLSIEEFKQKNPVEIAQMYYLDKENAVMNEQLVHLLKQAWQQVIKDDSIA